MSSYPFRSSTSLPLLPFARTYTARKKEGFFHSLFLCAFDSYLAVVCVCLFWPIGNDNLDWCNLRTSSARDIGCLHVRRVLVFRVRSLKGEKRSFRRDAPLLFA